MLWSGYAKAHIQWPFLVHVTVLCLFHSSLSLCLSPPQMHFEDSSSVTLLFHFWDVHGPAGMSTPLPPRLTTWPCWRLQLQCSFHLRSVKLQVQSPNLHSLTFYHNALLPNLLTFFQTAPFPNLLSHSFFPNLLSHSSSPQIFYHTAVHFHTVKLTNFSDILCGFFHCLCILFYSQETSRPSRHLHTALCVWHHSTPKNCPCGYPESTFPVDKILRYKYCKLTCV